MGFFTKQIIGILGSQIETKQVSNLFGVLTILRCYRLQVENMDQIIIVVKNWLDDSCANFKQNLDFKQYLKVEDYLVEKNNNLIEEHNFFEELEIDGD